MRTAAAELDHALPILLCLSHLRWDSVFQRPHHLMTRAARTHRVIYFEEPRFIAGNEGTPQLALRREPHGVLVATPCLAEDTDAVRASAVQEQLLHGLLADLGGPVACLWFYTPLALTYAARVMADVVVFDVMDELSAFKGACPQLLLLERQLLRRADLLFTGGPSLHHAKARLHPRAHLFSSSVDAAHFAQARVPIRQPEDQESLERPRIGFHGVIDERMDLDLLASMAAQRPTWQFVMLGPIAKIDPSSLPQAANLHWLGQRGYAELPAYLSGWDVGLMPFAINEATRFISPTKTPEFLAAGVPVACTPIADVVHVWGREGLVQIADGVEQMLACIDALLRTPEPGWLARVDQRLGTLSWDTTWQRMGQLIAGVAADAVTASAVTQEAWTA